MLGLAQHPGHKFLFDVGGFLKKGEKAGFPEAIISVEWFVTYSSGLIGNFERTRGRYIHPLITKMKKLKQ